LIHSIKLFAFDLDGVIYLGDQVLPGAPELVSRLQKMGKEVFFVTNSTLFHRTFYAQRLKGMGIGTEPDRIITAAYATAWHLSKNGNQGKKVFLFGERGLKEELAPLNFRYLSEDDETQSDIVIVGLDRQMTYKKLCKAASDISAGAEFIGVNSDGVWPVERGVRPGVGAFVAALETATNRRAFIVGKPNTKMLQIAMKKARALPEKTLMVGDKPDSDIVMGKRLGTHTALVLTGLTRAEDLSSLPEEESPHLVAKNLKELANKLGILLA
jgi:4-nitrophenyl phosphatase